MALWRKTTALTVPLTAIAMMFVSAQPSQAALCNVGFVYGVAVDGSKVCVPLTKDVLGAIGATQAQAPKSTPTPAQTPPRQAVPPAQQPPQQRPSEAPPAVPAGPVGSAPSAATYVNSDSGQMVAAGPSGSFVDSNTKAPVQQSVVVPATALVPDDAVNQAVKEQVMATPPTASAVEPSSSPSAAPTAVTPAPATEQGVAAPAPAAASVTGQSGFQGMPVVFGSTLVLLGFAAIYFAYRSIANSRNPLHGRRRATR